ncbi:hypothetical protein Ga0100231_018570 [Opitutaceae bacterium TAV4]|nr:hypothetical protein Ga0100231_018570 [Opitutaceae bacterium TAV4]
MRSQQLKRQTRSLEAIAAPRATVEINEFPNLTRLPCATLQPEMFDECRAETLFVFQVHHIENAAIAIARNHARMTTGVGNFSVIHIF